MSRVISTLNGVTLIITLLITDLLSPLGLQVGFRFRVSGMHSCFRSHPTPSARHVMAWAMGTVHYWGGGGGCKYLGPNFSHRLHSCSFFGITL